MERLVGSLAFTTTVLVAIALAVGILPITDLVTLLGSAFGYLKTVDPVSFGLGAVASLIGVRIGSVPWAELRQRLAAAIFGLGRNAILASIAVGAFSVLLLY